MFIIYIISAFKLIKIYARVLEMCIFMLTLKFFNEAENETTTSLLKMKIVKFSFTHA